MAAAKLDVQGMRPIVVGIKYDDWRRWTEIMLPVNLDLRTRIWHGGDHRWLMVEQETN